ncbi:MAG: hypothetical protein AAF703_24055, partial [Cyanobacteria bacterium P01_D01_bin.105]
CSDNCDKCLHEFRLSTPPHVTSANLLLRIAHCLPSISTRRTTVRASDVSPSQNAECGGRNAYQKAASIT